MGYVLCGIIGLVIGFFAGPWVRRKLKTSSNAPGADPMLPEVLTDEFIKNLVERTIQDYEEKKTTIEIVKDINKLLEEGTP